MYLLVGFSPLLWIKTISKIFVTDFSDFLMKFWEISKKCSNFVNFRARKMFFFFKQVRISRQFLLTFMFYWYDRMVGQCALDMKCNKSHSIPDINNFWYKNSKNYKSSGQFESFGGICANTHIPTMLQVK